MAVVLVVVVVLVELLEGVEEDEEELLEALAALTLNRSRYFDSFTGFQLFSCANDKAFAAVSTFSMYVPYRRGLVS